MRTSHFQRILCAFAAATLSATLLASADEVTTTTTAGTISEFSPHSIVIRSETSRKHIHYYSTKTTAYVDDAGAPVAMDVIKSGLRVTVHYIHEGDRVVADRVIVHRHTTAAAPGVVEKHRTTTVPEAPVTDPDVRSADEVVRKAEKQVEDADKADKVDIK